MPDPGSCLEEISGSPRRAAPSAGAADARRPPSWHPLPGAFRILAAAGGVSLLLETARPDTPNDRSYLFRDPAGELVARSGAELDILLLEADRLAAEGRYLAGFFTYECGEHLVGLAPVPPAPPGPPLAWLGVFERAVAFDHRTGTILGNLPGGDLPGGGKGESQIGPGPPAAICAGELEIPPEAYRERLERIREYLSAGDSYQVNFTDRIRGVSDEPPIAIYETLLREQPVPFAACLQSPHGTVLSFSPELFYRTRQGRITLRPMKGTWRRGVNTAGDREAARRLRSDEKNRSEHVMIVDLMRNDLGRICEYGSVQVEELFAVERYSTLLQMTSPVTGRLRPGLSPSQVFRTLFPSGSITGAPKRRTMEIIRELEEAPRGVYTGAIGYFGPGGDACFNVAIRTLVLEGRQLVLGVGGGITAGSVAGQEFEECRLKGTFLTRRRPPFSLIETMRCEGGVELLPLHLERLADSADYFGIRYDAPALIAELKAAAGSCGLRASRLRLELHQSGSWSLSADPIEETSWNGRILMASGRIDSGDVFRHHKTTRRGLPDSQLGRARSLGFDEVLFLNESAQLAEGAISSLFLRIDGRWLTPASGCGVLPGVLRASILQSRADASECQLGVADLERADSILCCNALRGARPVHSVHRPDGSAIWRSGPR